MEVEWRRESRRRGWSWRWRRKGGGVNKEKVRYTHPKRFNQYTVIKSSIKSSHA